MSEEKSEQKHGETEESRWRRHRDPMSGLFWGLILILLGVVFFLSSQGWFPIGEWWQYLLIGLGVIFLIESLVRYANPTYHRPRFGRFVAGLVLIFVGLAFLLGFGKWWPLILIVIGLAVLLRVAFQKR